MLSLSNLICILNSFLLYLYNKHVFFWYHKIASIYAAIQQISFITIWFTEKMPHHIELCFYIVMFCDIGNILIIVATFSNPFLQNMMRDARMLLSYAISTFELSNCRRTVAVQRRFKKGTVIV
ncbi:hypothetical protein ACJX0J_019002 [Zea mays]